MTKKSYDDMTPAELRKELAFAVDMADIGRDPAWNPVMNDLDRRIKELEK